MKKRLTWLLSVSLTVMMLLPAGVMASPAVSAAPNETLSKIASEKAALLTEKYGTVSVQYALIDNGEIKVSGQSGINDIEGKKPLTKDTMYGTGSTSKMFATAAVMKLVDEGKVNLDTPLVQYIPDFSMKDERYKQITPRMLLNHSSGLQGSSFANSMLLEDNDTYAHDNLLKQLSTQTLKADPGAFSVYCNDGFTLAEILVERVSGKDFTAFIHEYFTGPLNMTHTKTPQDELDLGKMAGLYYPTYPAQLPNETVNVIGAGGIYSTAEDLVRFSTVFTGEAEGILTQQSVKAMEQEEYKKGLWPDEADNMLGYGLGWDSVNLYPFNDYGMKALVKGGDTILYHASLIVVPEQNMAAAVLSSGGSSSTNQMLASELLLQAMKEKGTITQLKDGKSFGKPVKAQMPGDLLQNAGYYGATGQQILVKITDNGDMSLTMPSILGYPEVKYVYTADGTFVDETGVSKVSFVKEDNGRVYLWNREYASLEGFAQMAVSSYMAEKLDPVEVSSDTAKAWAKRDQHSYYPLNEKYTSLVYLLMEPSLQITLNKDLPGYAADKKITGPDSAVPQHQIPGVGSRDTYGFQFYKQKGVEYFEASGSLYVSEKQLKPLYQGKKSTVSIQNDGLARWFSLPKNAAGKTLSVSMPENGAFAVYDAQGTCINFTVVSGKNEVKLPEGGTIVFAGDAGARFNISLNK
ncbi:serine hydrolase domain-containing protein [Paenibacillus dakarensis]|uniref:serine hydrolase domain-containing protein n=1 Tax=Paenibacillus dakarensis TaxID=1527293 RepID=UPI0006D5A733|nr:serine hydrolase domain-containing protein [Paenibacillus dakarensis]